MLSVTDAALDYLARGWSVLPLCPPDHVGVGKAHRGCGSPGKRPFFPDTGSGEWKQFQDERATEEQVRRWWGMHPGLNVGVALGPVSGLVGIDVDDEDGEELLGKLSGGEIPRTWEYTTGKGRRLLYRLPEGVEVTSHAYKRPGTEIEILRFMGRGGQVVLPPSVHPNGSVYAWKTLCGPDDIEPADAPEWMRGAAPQGTAFRPADGELITEGGRNNYLISVAGAMRKRGCQEEEIGAALSAINRNRFDPPLSEAEVASVARSAMRYAPDEFTGVTIKFPEPGTGAPPREEPEPRDETDVAGIADLKAAGAAVRWLWPGWIQCGVLTAVAAEGGTGKTRLAADLVRRIRRGESWPDGTPMTAERGRTVALWVMADNHHDEIVTVCEDFGIADCVKVNATRSDPYGGVTLEMVEDFAMLEKRIKVTRPLLVVIDTVGNSTDKNLSKQEDAKAYYQPLQVIARRQSIAVLCMTHLNAGGKVLGRRALEKVRTCLRMNAERVNDTRCKRRLEVLKSNSKYPDALGVTMGDHGNQYDNQPPPPPEDREPEAKVGRSTLECMDWLREQVRDQPRAVTELRSSAECKGWATKTLYAAKGELKLVETMAGNRKYWATSGQIPDPPHISFNGKRLDEENGLG